MGSAMGQDKLQGQQPYEPSPIFSTMEQDGTHSPQPHWVLSWGRTCCTDPSNSGLRTYNTPS